MLRSNAKQFATVSLFFLLSCSLSQHQNPSNKTIVSKKDIVVITGTASGLGKSIATKLTKLGYIVYGGDIDTEGNKYLEELGAHPFELDVRDSKLVTKKINEIILKSGKVDILINNAGYAEFGPIETTDIEDVINQFEVNVFGYARMQAAVLPHMRERKSGKIINISSAAGKISYPMLGWYSASKHAVEGMSDALRMEVEEYNISVVKIQPGSFRSNLVKKGLSKLESESIPKDYLKGVNKFKTTLKNIDENLPSADKVADIVITAVQANKPKSEYVVLDDAHYFLNKRRQLTNDEFYKKFQH